MDTPDPADIPEIGGLDDFAPETPASAGADSADSASLMSVVRAEVSDETGAPRPLSRVEAAHARRAASSVATPRRWTFSSVATRCHRTISWVAARSRHAISSVASRPRAGRLVRRNRQWPRRLVGSHTRSGRAVASMATGSAGAASSVASGSREAISSTAEQARHAIASVAAHSRRRISAAVALLALGYDSWSRAAERAVRGARGRFARRPDRTPSPAGELRDLESEGFVRRRRARSRRGVIRRAAVAVVARPGAASDRRWRRPRSGQSRSPAPAPASSGDDQRRAGSRRGSGTSHCASRQARLSTASLRAVWNRSDTRSLQRALNNLRSQTLALHRCGMQVTAADRAIARCDGSSHATYTIDFQRFADRWVIQRVSSR